MRLEFHPEAELEFIEAAVHYELRVPGLGGRFGSEVRRATDLLLEHPEIGHPVDPNLRQFVLHQFPFRLFLQRDIRCAAHRGCRAPKPPAGLLAIENWPLTTPYCG